MRNGGVPVAIARTSARVRKEPDSSAGSTVPENHSCTHSVLAAGNSVEVVGRKGRNYSGECLRSNRNGRCARAAVVKR